MPNRKWLPAFVVLALMAALLLGLLHIAGIGSAGSYPKMSSLNSGPDGAALLFDALSGIPSLSVTRNYLPFEQWRPSRTTVLLFAVGPNTLDLAEAKDLEELEKLAQPDNRLLLCIDDSGELRAETDPKKKPVIKARWGVQVVKASDNEDSDLEFSLQHDESWKPLSGVENAWEKKFGRGAIVIALDSEQFSNKNVAVNRPVQALLPLLIAPNTSVAFEEIHLGIEESGSIAGLARRYRLQGLVAGLSLLAILFIWNRSVSFPPTSQFAKSRERQVVGADSRSMFADLIARHLPPQALIDSCVAEWNRVKPQQRLTLEPQKKLDPVTAYSQLQETLRGKRSRT